MNNKAELKSTLNTKRYDIKSVAGRAFKIK